MLPQILYLYIFRVLIHKNSSNEPRALPIPLFFSSSDRMASKTVFWPTVAQWAKRWTLGKLRITPKYLIWLFS